MGISHSLQWGSVPPVRLLGHRHTNCGSSHARNNKENAKDPEKGNSESGSHNETIL